MHLEKLEIQGFKSFANRNVLVFPDPKEGKRGITVIVGPNGSGKSNIADSIRWALGEQSMKTLRGKKSEDIIFSGSDKKGKLGMAEVSLHLNNEDQRVQVDYSHIVLTRRLYRDGDSEYLINNSKVRLTDIQILLAKANFGQKTYSVIGQGTVEGFLNTSISERKEFFDEATGVKQFQIKRDNALNKLKSSYENLGQAKILLSEIEPRLRSLTKQVNKLKKRGEFELELQEVQYGYYNKLWNEINGKLNEVNERILDKEKRKREGEIKLEQLNKDHGRLERRGEGESDYSSWQREMNVLRSQRDAVVKKMAVLDAKLQVKLEQEGKFDLSWLSGRNEEISSELRLIEDDIRSMERSIAEEKSTLLLETESKRELLTSIAGLNKRLLNASRDFKDSDLGEIKERLENSMQKIERLSAESDIELIRAVLNEVKESLRKVLSLAGGKADRIEIDGIHAELVAKEREREEIEGRINSASIRIGTLEEQIRMLKGRKMQLEAEARSVELKLSEFREGLDEGAIKEQKGSLASGLSELEARIEGVRGKLEGYSKLEEEKRKQIFSLQRTIQALQQELNAVNSVLSGLKVDATRHETRLEDLENEIRQNHLDLKEIKSHKNPGEVDYALAREKMNYLKKQIDLIGGIDPEIEKEYIETSQRFEFLDGQVDDLMKAIGSLEKIIKELDITIKERFDKEFKIIAKKFEEYFRILFNGGSAKIVKVMESEIESEELQDSEQDSGEGRAVLKVPENPIDLKKIKHLQKHNATGLAGIEIQATPPGKKIRSIAMLSGGERALTAIALICAIISANPSPFVVLDEVDAALDEANSERLAKILDDLSEKTQFIVVSHNRASMRKAQILYGVTMQDDGVSKLLSVKLEDIANITD